MNNHYETLLRIRNHLMINIVDHPQEGFMNAVHCEDIEDLNKILETMDEQPPIFVIAEDEAKHLWDYFFKRAGYISVEFDLPVHKTVDRLKKWVEKRA